MTSTSKASNATRTPSVPISDTSPSPASKPIKDVAANGNKSSINVKRNGSALDTNGPEKESANASRANNRYGTPTQLDSDTNSNKASENKENKKGVNDRSTPPTTESTTPPQQTTHPRYAVNPYASSSTFYTQEPFVSPDLGSLNGYDYSYLNMNLQPSLLSPQPHVGSMMQPTPHMYASNGSYLTSPFAEMANGQGSGMMNPGSNITHQGGSPYGYGGYTYYDPSSMECQWPSESRPPYFPPMRHTYGQSIHLNPRRNRPDESMIAPPSQNDSLPRQQGYDQHYHTLNSGGIEYYGYGGSSSLSSNLMTMNKINDHQSYFTPYGQIIHNPGPPIQLSNANKGPDGANLFIFHIPNQFTNLDMYHLFQPFGNLISVRIMVEKGTGRSRGFGFVSYDSPESATSAIQKLNGYTIGNKRLKVQHKQATLSHNDGYESNADESHSSPHTSSIASPATSPSQSSVKVKEPSESSMDMDQLRKTLPKSTKEE